MCDKKKLPKTGNKPHKRIRRNNAGSSQGPRTVENLNNAVTEGSYINVRKTNSRLKHSTGSKRIKVFLSNSKTEHMGIIRNTKISNSR